MPDRVKFLASFRVRLTLLLTLFLILTIAVVILLDKVVQGRIERVVADQNLQVNDAVSDGFGDLAQAMSVAMDNLNSETYLYEKMERGELVLPPTIAHIIITDEGGNVKDTTLPTLREGEIPVPDRPEGSPKERIGDPVESEVEIPNGPHQGALKTYNLPITTAKGLYWVVIVQQQQGIINRIDKASRLLTDKSRELSNYRLAATAGLLLVALVIAVIVAWRVTQPVKELARAARRVAAGDLDFSVGVERSDEVGQLESTFNEMISELKSKRELEEKLNQAEKAAVIGRLTQGVAHEIRNPLNVLNLSIDLVSSKFAPADEPRRLQFSRILSTIKDEILRLNRMVSDLLNFGRPAKLNLKPIDLSHLVRETMDLIRPQADEQGVRIAVEGDGAPFTIEGDAERLRSCLSNITINALQAMPSGGRLTTRLYRENGLTSISITDTGAGISDESLTKIFEPYFSTKQAGFGLGLAVTRKIIEEHNGKIEVESREGGGTTFTMKLPAAQPGGITVQERYNVT